MDLNPGIIYPYLLKAVMGKKVFIYSEAQAIPWV
jgi:hypothetical protein